MSVTLICHDCNVRGQILPSLSTVSVAVLLLIMRLCRFSPLCYFPAKDKEFKCKITFLEYLDWGLIILMAVPSHS